MKFEDKNLTCSECGATFTFTVAEQEFFQTKGFTNEPKRCPSCRMSRRAQRFGNSGTSDRPERQMFQAVCAQCGKDTEIPFEPRQGRPVYCSDCFNKMKTSRQA